MSEILNKIINYLNNNQLDKAMSLCGENKEKKNEHLIANIKGVILFKQQRYGQAKAEFLKSSDLDKNFLNPYQNFIKKKLN